MKEKHIVPITNGVGSIKLINGTYNVKAEVGFDILTPNPFNTNTSQFEFFVKDGNNEVNDYSFMLSANGILKIHVRESEASNIPIVGAIFMRTDITGSIEGDYAITDSDGNLKFINVPFSPEGSQKVYFKQILGDGKHSFIEELNSFELVSNEETVKIDNPIFTSKEFNLFDTSFVNIPVDLNDLNLEGGN